MPFFRPILYAVEAKLQNKYILAALDWSLLWSNHWNLASGQCFAAPSQLICMIPNFYDTPPRCAGAIPTPGALASPNSERLPRLTLSACLTSP
jgi:hypothetical protein